MTDQTSQISKDSAVTAFLKKWTPLLALLVLMLFGFSQGWHHYFTLESLVANRADLASYVDQHFGLALLLYGLIYCLAVAISFPGASFLTIVGGLLFGWIIGGLVTVVAASLGAGIVFLAARSAIGSSLRARAGGFVERFATGFAENAFHYMLFLRLVPLFPFWLINIVPALLKVRFDVYLLATLIGILPGTLAYALVGSGLDSVIAAQLASKPGCLEDPSCTLTLDTSAVITGELIAALVAMGAVALIPPLLKTLKKERKGENSA
ncbi:TVP38/TMEM64 family protein [uncultured Cohaesibacter sp.]|uniref:TVP38/TMEM64 family protein n=1 Tax=uncultured Cohaesibacter sp. TaxID=1002546 RepID=UPI0029C863BC|nr:TVP38/TMEM64 family protein [uncultured Cohaesibacter sp.]